MFPGRFLRDTIPHSAGGFAPGLPGFDPPVAAGAERGSRAEWMTMDQSNKRADLSIPSGLNPAAARIRSRLDPTTVVRSHRHMCRYTSTIHHLIEQGSFN